MCPGTISLWALTIPISGRYSLFVGVAHCFKEGSDAELFPAPFFTISLRIYITHFPIRIIPHPGKSPGRQYGLAHGSLLTVDRKPVQVYRWPMILPSTLMTGISSAAVPVRKTWSAI